MAVTLKQMAEAYIISIEQQIGQIKEQIAQANNHLVQMEEHLEECKKVAEAPVPVPTPASTVVTTDGAEQQTIKLPNPFDQLQQQQQD